MNQRTKTVLILAILYCLFFVLVLSSALYLIRVQGTKLAGLQTTISEQSAKEATYNTVMRLLETTDAERATLASFFLTEKDTISFISELELAAVQLGIKLETTELSVTEAVTKDSVTTPATLVVGLKFEGVESAVKAFVTTLEHIPYHATIPELSVTNQMAGGVWQGKSRLIITLTP